MKIYLNGEKEILLSDFEKDSFELTLKSEALYYGAIAMFVTSLGKCTYAVLSSYAMRLDLDPNEINSQLTWEYNDNPTVVSKINMQINWPALPDSRKKAVARATHKCTIHNTIKECVEISVSVNVGK